MASEDLTLSPQVMVDSYLRAYKQVHGRTLIVRHQFGEWYYINGETVHRLTLLQEITRLRGIAHKRRLQETDRPLVQRLIARLRGI
jgi:hypothetical protein